MPVKKSKNTKKIQSDIREYFKKLPRQVGVLALQHFKRNFAQQGFYDDSLKKWRPRKTNSPRNKGRALLVNKGRGRRSLRILQSSSDLVIVGADVGYMAFHNTGGVIRRQVTVRTHERKPFSRTWRGKKVDVNKTIIMRHQRMMNLNMPMRKFVGNSKHLNKRIDQKVRIDLRKIQ